VKREILEESYARSSGETRRLFTLVGKWWRVKPQSKRINLYRSSGDSILSGARKLITIKVRKNAGADTLDH